MKPINRQVETRAGERGKNALTHDLCLIRCHVLVPLQGLWGYELALNKCQANHPSKVSYQLTLDHGILQPRSDIML